MLQNGSGAHSWRERANRLPFVAPLRHPAVALSGELTAGDSGVALQSDGKVVAVGGTGSTDSSGATEFSLARYNANGSLDTSFSGDGKQTTDFGGAERATGVALQADGKIVALGLTGGLGSDFALARYNPNGSLDTSFSSDGKQTTDVGALQGVGATGMALQGDGKIVVVGSGGGPTQTDDFALARYLGG